MASEQPKAGPENVQRLVDEGLRLHQEGRIIEAEGFYRQALARNSECPDALHLIGVIAYQTGRYDVAVELIGTAIKIDGAEARYQSHLALALKELGRFEEALAACNTAIRINAEYAEAHYNLGIVLFSLGRFHDVISACNIAIRINPEFTKAHVNLGNALKESGRLEDAVAAYRAAIRISPEFIDAHFNLGVVLFDLRRFEESSIAYNAAVRINPQFAEAYTFLGNSLKELGRLDEAVNVHNTAIQINPAYAEAYSNLGNTLNELGRLEEALAAHHIAIGINPELAEAHFNLGNALKELGRLDEAITAYNTVISINQEFAEAHFNLGNTLKEMLRNEDALVAFNAAIRIRPDFTDAHSNRGASLFELGRIDEAIASYRVALGIRPNYAEVHFNESIALLLLGEFAIGWQKYEWRWHEKTAQQVASKFSKPRWDGASANGRTVMLYAEQGLGDTIQFCRYASLAATRSGRIMLAIPRSLLRLFSDLKGVDHLVAVDEPFPDFDLQCPLMSLPLVFGTTLDTIPAPVSYLRAEAGAVKRWEKQLSTITTAEQSSARIGIVWSGSPSLANDSNRSINLDALVPLLTEGKYQFFSLQKDIRHMDLSVLRKLLNVVDLSSELSDFSETAAIIANLDLIITVDTAVAHLAGALGIPVWIMLPFVPDFRWLLDRTDSPWYPSARLFRQSVVGDWTSVFRDIQAALDLQFGESTRPK